MAICFSRKPRNRSRRESTGLCAERLPWADPSSQFEITSSPFRWVQSKLQFKTCAPYAESSRSPSELPVPVAPPSPGVRSPAGLCSALTRPELEKCLNRSELIISAKEWPGDHIFYFSLILLPFLLIKLRRSGDDVINKLGKGIRLRRYYATPVQRRFEESQRLQEKSNYFEDLYS